MAKGLLLMAFDLRTTHADEFHAWYDREHVPERLRVPGFLNAERWIGEDDPNLHIATYDLASHSVLRSPAYLAVSGAHQTPWTKRVTAMARRLLRFEGTQIVPGDAAAPEGAGGLLMAAITPKPGTEAEFTAWYNEEHLPQLAAVPGVLAARRFQAADRASERGFVAVYHLRDVAVSHSDAWAKAAHTPWTERMRPHLLDTIVMRMKRYQGKV
ncbi:MAG TPA: hypothetical protein VHB27_14695 [Rhodopila sp.]|uniref:hypothetical protein n=1 Tax=Rhodopila sp. TaxID=2480087 RepID=UPI002D01A450|nr:hypothetical protein [Rhodopila sp.]HVY16472.1 hypothetical protein [Rhodopila sp.]